MHKRWVRARNPTFYALILVRKNYKGDDKDENRFLVLGKVRHE